MILKKLVGKFCEKVYDRIQDNKFLENSKMRKQDFTRKRKMGFADTIIVVLNKTGKSLHSGIRVFMKTMKVESESYSNQAFSKGRMRVKFEAFRELFQMTVDEFYKEFKVKKYKGYRVSAVDGTKINLPYNEDSVKEFGIQESTNDQIQALGSCLYDVLNEMIIDAVIASHDESEGNLAKQHLDYLLSISHNKELILFDRGYPSADLISFIESKKFYYLMRCNKTFISGMKEQITSDDCVISYRFKKKKITVKIRIITVVLSTGNKETLITNIFDKSFTVEDFAQLYHMRLEIETNYDDIKNKLEIENFSGTTPLAIKQDFFATMFLRNLASMMIFENEEEINNLHNSSNNLYQYKANVNTVVSILKTDLIEMLIVDSDFKRRKLWRKITKEISHSVIPIRPNRSFERKKKHLCEKYPQNQKS